MAGAPFDEVLNELMRSVPLEVVAERVIREHYERMREREAECGARCSGAGREGSCRGTGCSSTAALRRNSSTCPGTSLRDSRRPFACSRKTQIALGPVATSASSKAIRMCARSGSGATAGSTRWSRRRRRCGSPNLDTVAPFTDSLPRQGPSPRMPPKDAKVSLWWGACSARAKPQSRRGELNPRPAPYRGAVIAIGGPSHARLVTVKVCFSHATQGTYK